MAVYIFERINIIGANRGKFVEHIRRKWAPHAERAHRVRLAGLWATAGSTAAWPEAGMLWEMDDWAHFARASAEQHPMEEQDPFELELWRQALEWRSGGESQLLIGSSFTPTVAQLRAKKIAGPAYQYEEVRTLPGKMDAYHEALKAEYLPVAESRGMKLMGAYRHALKPNCGINIWVLKSWDHCTEVWEKDESHPGVKRWRKRCAELLEDQSGWLLAPPPPGALRT